MCRKRAKNGFLKIIGFISYKSLTLKFRQIQSLFMNILQQITLEKDVYLNHKHTWKTFKSKLAIVKIKLKADAATEIVRGGMHSPE